MFRILITIFASFLVITGCSSANNEIEENLESENVIEEVDENEEIDNEPEEAANDSGDLTLQLLKSDEAAGITLDNNDIYTGLQSVIDQDPTIGASGDFTVSVVNIYNTESGAMLIMLGINRLDSPIKDVSFDLTIGNGDDEYVFEQYPFFIMEETEGVIESNSAIPIVATLSKGEEKLLRSFDISDVQVEIGDFEFEEVE
ncbi:hypothetical protein [Pseudogracilibacillus sp. SO30301A]|uniref:hypothetical protein n=1 Tax=Pseudogracilibacillus sp. SO30301A TaxID=3098291 RepID=UPI00300E31CA